MLLKGLSASLRCADFPFFCSANLTGLPASLPSAVFPTALRLVRDCRLNCVAPTSLFWGLTQSLCTSFAVAGVLHLFTPSSKLGSSPNEERLFNFVEKAFVAGTGIEPVFAP